jgi:hypothetical protein
MLWGSLQECRPEGDPFSLLAAVDLALFRQADPRFSKFAEKSVASLLEKQFPIADDFDFYRLFAALEEFVQGKIVFLEGGSVRAPFWKRMCSWMQAIVVLRMLPRDPQYCETLCSTIEANLSSVGHCSKLVDLLQEPMHDPRQLSARAVRREILGRLRNLEVRHRAAGRLLPLADQLERALQEEGSLAWLPGPLQGHSQPQLELPEVLQAQFSDLPIGELPAGAFLYSRIFLVPEKFGQPLQASLAIDSGQEFGGEPQLVRLWYVGLIAAGRRDRELADSVAAAVFSLVPLVKENSQIGMLFQCILIAAAALQDESAWAEWLKNHLAEMANRVPAGPAAKHLWNWLQSLQMVTKLHLGIEDRAAALASAAMS